MTHPRAHVAKILTDLPRFDPRIGLNSLWFGFFFCPFRLISACAGCWWIWKKFSACVGRRLGRIHQCTTLVISAAPMRQLVRHLSPELSKLVSAHVHVWHRDAALFGGAGRQAANQENRSSVMIGWLNATAAGMSSGCPLGGTIAIGTHLPLHKA